jgi:hypothetical protein
MQYKNLLMLVLLTLSAASCKQQNTTDATVQQAAENASKNALASESGSAVDTDSSGNASPSIPAPNAKAVLFEIYKQEVEEVSGNQLSDGRYVSYWNGQPFSYQGKNYFVAFAEATPASEIEYPAPENKVTLSQATYELVGNQWQLKKVQQDVGKFGSNNKAPAVDTVQKTAVFSNIQGKLILATPTVIFANMGIQFFFYEIFIFSPDDEKWKYLGNVKAGSDNTAGCAHEADSATTTKCAKSSAALQFSAAEGSSWPELKVLLKGTELDEAGKLVALSDKNAVTYRYDDKSSVYQIVR